MRWKWRLGFVLILGVEVPILYWAGVVMSGSAELVAYLGATIAAILIAMLVLRPVLFGLAGIWLFGVAGGAWYFLPYVSPPLALLTGTTLSTLGCAIGARFYRRVLALVLRRAV